MAQDGTTSPRGVVRPYDETRDLDAVRRIWHEIGWTTTDEELAHVGTFHRAGRTLVYEQDGAAESSCHVTRGRIRYQDDDLVLAAVTAVTTSRVARKQGAARRLLARMLAEEAADGAHVAALGIFDQGFYDTLGFGTLPYDHKVTFDPATLLVDVRARIPVRLTADDWQDVYDAMGSRWRQHGAIVLDDAKVMQAELGWHEQGFGLGYRDADGRLTHFLYGEAKGEHGPYKLTWFAYQDAQQLLELLALVRSLGDQVHAVELAEPPHVQLQDLLRQPFREGRRVGTEGYQQAAAWRQLRILDLDACLAAAHFPGHEVRCNLELHDPAVEHLPDGVAWEGTAGRFVLTLGPDCAAEPGHAEDLPTLRCGIGPLSRLLFGARPATSLAITTDLHAPPDLLDALDRTVRLPPPMLDWSF